MCHIVESCPQTKLVDDGVPQLNSSDDNIITCRAKNSGVTRGDRPG